jgi:hypothetical protein
VPCFLTMLMKCSWTGGSEFPLTLTPQDGETLVICVGMKEDVFRPPAHPIELLTTLMKCSWTGGSDFSLALTPSRWSNACYSCRYERRCISATSHSIDLSKLTPQEFQVVVVSMSTPPPMAQSSSSIKLMKKSSAPSPAGNISSGTTFK